MCPGHLRGVEGVIMNQTILTWIMKEVLISGGKNRVKLAHGMRDQEKEMTDTLTKVGIGKKLKGNWKRRQDQDARDGEVAYCNLTLNWPQLMKGWVIQGRNGQEAHLDLDPLVKVQKKDSWMVAFRCQIHGETTLIIRQKILVSKEVFGRIVVLQAKVLAVAHNSLRSLTNCGPPLVRGVYTGVDMPVYVQRNPTWKSGAWFLLQRCFSRCQGSRVGRGGRDRPPGRENQQMPFLQFLHEYLFYHFNLLLFGARGIGMNIIAVPPGLPHVHPVSSGPKFPLISEIHQILRCFSIHQDLEGERVLTCLAQILMLMLQLFVGNLK
ncbi:Hypothetical predicted protein [Olea europaea subsp. europaea]|uniref:Uncharacterized protein n=1 Tax=Olea europaea subsp. europaea TaxID=158383 RepID=A0A8S0QBN5_OLEEU|nr:Hypothetical predicted protein [Olea europaea subsp. europaea]